MSHGPASADAPLSGETATGQYLTFQLAGELFALPILSVQEIRGWERVSRVPNTPEHVLGVINLRGAVVPVLDVRARLGMPSVETSPTTVVIVVRVATHDGAAATVGCVVDAVSDVANLADADVRPAPDVCGGVESHYLKGVSTLEKRLVLVLDLPRFLNAAAGIAVRAA